MTKTSEQGELFMSWSAWPLTIAVLPKLIAGPPLNISNIAAERVSPLCKWLPLGNHLPSILASLSIETFFSRNIEQKLAKRPSEMTVSRVFTNLETRDGNLSGTKSSCLTFPQISRGFSVLEGQLYHRWVHFLTQLWPERSNEWSSAAALQDCKAGYRGINSLLKIFLSFQPCLV